MHAEQGSNFMQAPSLPNLDLEDSSPVKGKGPLSSVMGSLGWPIMVGLVGFWTFLFLLLYYYTALFISNVI